MGKKLDAKLELDNLYKSFKACIKYGKRTEVFTCKGTIIFTPVVNHPSQTIVTIVEN